MLKSNSNQKMHGISEIGPNVPAFLVKLWKLVEDPKCDLIYWSESGMSFIIVAQARFAREVLPLHYKHNNMASFIRQLNMYDFHKIASVESGGLKSDKDEMEFAHQYFIRDHPYLLENIKRKLSNPKSGVVTTDQFNGNRLKNGSQSDIFAKVLSDINILKGRQESWDTRLSTMKRENEALWRELAVFRQKLLKQEQIINRLIHFIVTIVQPSRKVPIRRSFPLMLNDTQQVKKIKINGSRGNQLSQGSPPGPTIHEIDTDVLIAGNEKGENSETTGNSDTEYINSDFPGSSNEYAENEYVEIVSPEPQVTNETVVSSTSSTSSKKDNPSDWLEIVLTEDDMITNPLTPIDPAKVNPTVAAATLKHMESNNKITTPVTIKIPSIVSSESGKKRTIPEKKIIYLTDVKKIDKNTKKKQIKQGSPKIETVKSRGLNLKKNDGVGDSANELLDMVCDEGTLSSKIVTHPPKITASGKRKLSIANSSNTVKIPSKRQNIQTKPTIEAASELCPPLLTPDTLENSLKCKFEAAKRGVISTENEAEKQPTTDDSFWKLESLYDGSIGVNQLISDVDEDSAIDESVRKGKKDIMDDEKSSNVNLCDMNTTDLELPKLTPKEGTESNDSVADFPPESMAVVCQTPSQSSLEELSRELSSHVDNVQGEIDYLKEMLKEGYSLDMNNILGCFNDDPLSYGIIPPVEEDSKEKENEKGNEVMTYGTPPNLMDLVDLFGTPGTVQEWSSVMSPGTPTVSELMTPPPIASPSTLGKSGKRRKI